MNDEIESVEYLNELGEAFAGQPAGAACSWAAKEIEQLQGIVRIAKELAGHVNRPIALGGKFDRKVLQYWACKTLEAIREAEKAREQ